MFKYLPSLIGALLISSSSVLAEPFAARSIEPLAKPPTLGQNLVQNLVQNMGQSIITASERDVICAKPHLAALQRKQQHLKQLLLQHTLTVGSTMQVLTMEQASGIETLDNTASKAIRPTCLRPYPS